MFTPRLTAPALSLCFFLLDLCGIILLHANVSGDVRVVVKEGRDAILPCSLSTKENAEEKLFDWKKDGQQDVFFYDAGIHSNNGRPGQDQQFKGRVSHFQDELKYGNASIIIRNTKVTDSGDYSCDFPHLQPRQIFNIQLVVVVHPHFLQHHLVYGCTAKDSVAFTQQRRSHLQRPFRRNPRCNSC